MGGEVPKSLNYDKWLRQQPVSFQKDVLGGGDKFSLFRAGLTQDRFVDIQTGETFTLGDLRQREPAAFERAGL